MRNVTNRGEARETTARGTERAGAHNPYMDHHVTSSPKSVRERVVELWVVGNMYGRARDDGSFNHILGKRSAVSARISLNHLVHFLTVRISAQGPKACVAPFALVSYIRSAVGK